jgi:hypothetical protein
MTSENSFKHYKEVYAVKLRSGSLKFNDIEANKYDKNNIIEKSLSFISDNKKILISLNIGMYNFYYMCLPTILKAHEEHPDAELLLDSSGVMGEGGKPYYDFLATILNDLNIKYQIIDATHLDEIYINNFYVCDSFNYCDKDASRVYNACKTYVNKQDIEPFRKVYISRKKVEDRTFPPANPGIEFSGDNRIIDEEVLENFFTNIGVEVVNPEDFKDFREQINYFYETKMIISLTSSGIANALFMKPRGIVIELVTPLLQVMSWPSYPIDENTPLIDIREDLHHIYNALVYNKDHDYLSIQNRDRKSATIIDKIKNSKSIMKLIKED